MANGDDKISYPMVGGEGPYSYSANSVYQRDVVDASKQMIREAISNNLDFTNPCFDTCKAFQIADLGCSVGPNTFIAIQHIIEAVDENYQNEYQTSPTLEFQAFFNDHAENDFNTLFKTLPPSRRYFPAGVPGSFHGRLFPKSSLHFVHTSSTIHWLSKVPEELIDNKSSAWNKNSVYCSGTSKEVVEAYSTQFKKDFGSFLAARAQELVGGGLMVILVTTLPNGMLLSQTDFGMIYESFGSCLNDMAKLGLLNEEKVYSFNFPMYFPPVNELEESIKRNGCFSIERIENLPYQMNNTSPTVQFLISVFRAVAEGILKEHFGNEAVDDIFDYFAQRLVQNPLVFDNKSRRVAELFILLKRNTY